jgi:osmotically inducible protein OsmC
MTAERIRTTATVSLDKVDGGFAITGIHLDVTAKIPGADAQAYQKAATAAKEGCPMSKALKSVPITMDAKLEG